VPTLLATPGICACGAQLDPSNDEYHRLWSPSAPIQAAYSRSPNTASDGPMLLPTQGISACGAQPAASNDE